MALRKPTKKYYFSVEGEKWYLDWLQNVINAEEKSVYKVSLVSKVEKNPVKYVKSISIMTETEIYHLYDYESNEPVHKRQFTETIDNMAKAQKLGKNVFYKFGYSNLTFDLWIILHMADCNGTVYHRSHYINYINKAYNESFEDMHAYKKEDNFKRCLGKLQLSNVIDAINRAKSIMQRNQDNGYKLVEYKKYTYYEENPSLNVWEAIEKILKDCELM